MGGCKTVSKQAQVSSNLQNCSPRMQVCENTHGSKTHPNPGFRPPWTAQSVYSHFLLQPCDFCGSVWVPNQAQCRHSSNSIPVQIRGTAHTGMPHQLLPLVFPHHMPPQGEAEQPAEQSTLKAAWSPPNSLQQLKCSADFHRDNPKAHRSQERESLLPSSCQFTELFPPVLEDLSKTRFNLINPTGGRAPALMRWASLAKDSTGTRAREAAVLEEQQQNYWKGKEKCQLWQV